VVEFDAATWDSVVDLLDDFAVKLAFPSQFGRNLDALNDCVRDVASHVYGWRAEATGLVVVLRNFDALAALDREVAHRVLDIVANRARSAMLIGNRVLCLVQADDGRLVLDPEGAVPVVWNDAERRQSDREAARSRTLMRAGRSRPRSRRWRRSGSPGTNLARSTRNAFSPGFVCGLRRGPLLGCQRRRRAVLLSRSH